MTFFTFNCIQLLAFAPIIGFLISRIDAPKKKKSLLIVLILLLSPKILGYQLNYPILNYLICILLIAFLWELIFSKSSKIRFQTNTLIASIVLFFFAVISGFILTFMGSIKQKYAWQNNSYEIRYSKTQGWAGTGYLKIYDLHHNILFGLYSKKLATQSISSFDTTSNCQLIYKEQHIIFDNCTNEIMIDND